MTTETLAVRELQVRFDSIASHLHNSFTPVSLYQPVSILVVLTVKPLFPLSRLVAAFFWWNKGYRIPVLIDLISACVACVLLLACTSTPRVWGDLSISNPSRIRLGLWLLLNELGWWGTFVRRIAWTTFRRS